MFVFHKLDFFNSLFLYLQLSDSTRPKSVLSCKCNVTKEQGKLEVYKASFLIPVPKFDEVMYEYDAFIEVVLP